MINQTFKHATLDDLDRKLLALLQLNARESVSQLARHLEVARTTVLARLEKLENSGVIAGYSVVLGHDVSNEYLYASVGISLQPKSGARVFRALQLMPEVHTLWSVSGEYDYLAILCVPTAHQLDQLLDNIGLLDGVNHTRTSIILAKKIDRHPVVSSIK